MLRLRFPTCIELALAAHQPRIYLFRDRWDELAAFVEDGADQVLLGAGKPRRIAIWGAAVTARDTVLHLSLAARFGRHPWATGWSVMWGLSADLGCCGNRFAVSPADTAKASELAVLWPRPKLPPLTFRDGPELLGDFR
jgi:hypothetical protein